jgi:translation initiation factor 2B subunit (eIF-2B alpha/beta/delta family)
LHTTEGTIQLHDEGHAPDTLEEQEVAARSEIDELTRDEIVDSLTATNADKREKAKKALDDVAERLERMANEIRQIGLQAEFPIASNLERDDRS